MIIYQFISLSSISYIYNINKIYINKIIIENCYIYAIYKNFTKKFEYKICAINYRYWIFNIQYSFIVYIKHAECIKIIYFYNNKQYLEKLITIK